MAVSLVNPTKQPFTVTLYHDIFCKAAGACVCTKEAVRRPVRKKDGTFGERVENRLVPMSLSIPPGGRKLRIHDAVMKIQQVKAAVRPRVGLLRAVIAQEPPAFPTQLVPPSPTQAQPHGEVSPIADAPRSRTQSRRGRSER